MLRDSLALVGQSICAACVNHAEGVTLSLQPGVVSRDQRVLDLDIAALSAPEHKSVLVEREFLHLPADVYCQTRL